MKPQLRSCLLWVLALVCGTLLTAVSRGDDGPAFLLANEGRLAPSDYSLSDLKKMFSAFKHAPLNTAGFDALVMSMHYADPSGLGDPNEAYAFSFLLSNALDWAPGSYCTRHCFFICQQSPELMQSLASNYAPELVGRAVRSWKATNGVGGTLVKFWPSCNETRPRKRNNAKRWSIAFDATSVQRPFICCRG